MKRLFFLSIFLILHTCVISQYVIINDTSMGVVNLPFAEKYINASHDGMCSGWTYNFYIDLDMDNINDVRLTSKCSWGGPYYSGSLSIETFNNFEVHVDTNFQTLMAQNTDTGLYYINTKIPVPKKYLLNDTIYQNAYSWDSIETTIGAYSHTSYGQSITWIDLDYFQGHTTYIALTKNDGDYKTIYYLQIYVYGSSAMSLLAVMTNDPSVLPNYFQNCFPYGITFNKQSQIDNFLDNAPNCSTIEGSVAIIGDEIDNLNGLSNITSIKGYLKIINTNSLINLYGLHNLNTIGGYLFIHDNLVLKNIAT